MNLVIPSAARPPKAAEPVETSATRRHNVRSGIRLTKKKDEEKKSHKTFLCIVIKNSKNGKKINGKTDISPNYQKMSKISNFCLYSHKNTQFC